VLGVALAAVAAADLVVQRIERGRLRRAAEANRALGRRPALPSGADVTTGGLAEAG
jgi:hypothetical protein